MFVSFLMRYLTISFSVSGCWLIRSEISSEFKRGTGSLFISRYRAEVRSDIFVILSPMVLLLASPHLLVFEPFL